MERRWNGDVTCRGGGSGGERCERWRLQLREPSVRLQLLSTLEPRRRSLRLSASKLSMAFEHPVAPRRQEACHRCCTQRHRTAHEYGTLRGGPRGWVSHLRPRPVLFLWQSVCTHRCVEAPAVPQEVWQASCVRVASCALALGWLVVPGVLHIEGALCVVPAPAARHISRGQAEEVCSAPPCAACCAVVAAPCSIRARFHATCFFGVIRIETL